jgi:hypothetical protein
MIFIPNVTYPTDGVDRYIDFTGVVTNFRVVGNMQYATVSTPHGLLEGSTTATVQSGTTATIRVYPAMSESYSRNKITAWFP